MGQASSQTVSSKPAASQPEILHIAIKLKSVEYSLEPAVDEKAREIGLMHRDHLDLQTGMLFIYPREQVLNFWMKNCLMDLDVIFIDARGTITAIHEMMKEPLQRNDEPLLEYENRLKTYSSRLPSAFAIELAAGEAKRLGFMIGDSIEFDRAKLRKLAR